MVTEHALKEAGWSWPPALVGGLSTYEKEFVAFEFLSPRSLKYYLRRIDYLGLTGLGKVLDAGCGMGQWSIALAARNGSVEGIDLSERRVEIARAICNFMQVSTCTFQSGSLERLPYQDSCFDAVFCYGVFMFTNMPQTLREFQRVLKPGGRFYINANSWGWYLHLLRDVPWNRLPALRYIWNTFMRRTQNIVVTESSMRKSLEDLGLAVAVIASEGSASFLAAPEGEPPAPGYPRQYFGVRSMIEAIGTKR